MGCTKGWQLGEFRNVFLRRPQHIHALTATAAVRLSAFRLRTVQRAESLRALSEVEKHDKRAGAALERGPPIWTDTDDLLCLGEIALRLHQTRAPPVGN